MVSRRTFVNLLSGAVCGAATFAADGFLVGLLNGKSSDSVEKGLNVYVRDICSLKNHWEVDPSYISSQVLKEHGFVEDDGIFTLDKFIFRPEALIKGRWHEIVCVIEPTLGSLSDETYCYYLRNSEVGDVEGIDDLIRAEVVDLHIRMAPIV